MNPYHLLVYSADVIQAQDLLCFFKEKGHVAQAIFELSGVNDQVIALRPDVVVVLIDVIEAFVFDWITGLNGCVPVVIFSNDARTEKIQAAIRAGVASYVVDGFRLDRMIPILETAISRHHEFQLIKQELNLAKSDLADRKLIDRAKGLVMAQRGCSESDAYHLLRKMAMNQKKRLADVAHDILIVGEVFKS